MHSTYDTIKILHILVEWCLDTKIKYILYQSSTEMSMFNIVNGFNISLAPGGEARPGGGGTKRMGKNIHNNNHKSLNLKLA